MAHADKLLTIKGDQNLQKMSTPQTIRAVFIGRAVVDVLARTEKKISSHCSFETVGSTM